MLQNLEHNILALEPAAGTQVLLGYSGGVDSEVLASLLSEFALKYPQFHCRLVYVHHGLSSNADTWAEHCSVRAALYGLPIKICRVTVDQGPGTSLEAQARKARYQAIAELMQPGDILLTGHHQDDQLETLLLALKRGQGPRGLAAMGQCQAFDADKWQLRPLLHVSRAQIEAQAAQLGLTHIQDESNFDTRFDRNFLRQEIIPALKARWPHIAQTASRSAALCAEQQLALDEVVAARLQPMTSISPWGQCLSLGLLAEQACHWQKLLLRAFIEQQGLELPSQVQLEQALKQVLSARNDASVELRFGTLILRRFAGLLYAQAQAQKALDDDTAGIAGTPGNGAKIEFKPGRADKPVQFGQFQIEFGNHQSAPCSSASDRSSHHSDVRIRMPKANEQWCLGTASAFGLSGAYRCHPHFRDKGRELKKCWQEAGVPPWLRAQLPLLVVDGVLAAVVGLWVEKAFVAKADEPGFSLSLRQ